jgi:AGCS family alanine or glycine:cation symporter
LPLRSGPAISPAWHGVVGIPKLASGITIAILTWLVIIGGIKSIGCAAEKLSPLNVGLYLAGGLIVIVLNLARVPSVVSLILERAFSLQSAAGGGLGILVAMRYGTAAVAYGTAQSSQPVQQGLNAIIEVFVVSFVTSSISALTILLTGVWESGLTSTAAVASAFNTRDPWRGIRDPVVRDPWSGIRGPGIRGPRIHDSRIRDSR